MSDKPVTKEVEIKTYDGPAGGWPALRSVAAHLLHQDVPVLGAKTLLHANQPDGFDCPGCAWPWRTAAAIGGAGEERTQHRARHILWRQK